MTEYLQIHTNEELTRPTAISGAAKLQEVICSWKMTAQLT
jgi:hypothetical protein